MAVNTTGNKDLDAMKTNSIALDVVNLSKVILKQKSSLLVKIFSGKDENILIKNANTISNYNCNNFILFNKYNWKICTNRFEIFSNFKFFRN